MILTLKPRINSLWNPRSSWKNLSITPGPDLVPDPGRVEMAFLPTARAIMGGTGEISSSFASVPVRSWTTRWWMFWATMQPVISAPPHRRMPDHCLASPAQ